MQTSNNLSSFLIIHFDLPQAILMQKKLSSFP